MRGHTSNYNHGSTTAGGASVPAAQIARFEHMLRRPENRDCFDCGARQPRWASTNLGVFFCLRCAGVHRAMGVHITKVKSTNMDTWEPEMIAVIEHVGNARGRLLYEYEMPASARPSPQSDTRVVERLLRDKYERKRFYHPRFQELWAKLMETPIAAAGEDAGASAPLDASKAQQPAQPAQPPKAPVDDLWGEMLPAPPPASSATPAHVNNNNNTNNNNNNNGGKISSDIASLFDTPSTTTNANNNDNNIFRGGNAANAAWQPQCYNSNNNNNNNNNYTNNYNNYTNGYNNYNTGSKSEAQSPASPFPSPVSPQAPYAGAGGGTGVAKDDIMALFAENQQQQQRVQELYSNCAWKPNSASGGNNNSNRFGY